MHQAFRVVLRIAFALMVSGAASTISAADGQPDRYPWDRRPFFCQLQKNAKAPLCMTSDWPTYEITVDRLRELLWSGRFALLERALTELNASGQVDPGGLSHADAVQKTLGDLLRHQAQARTLGADLFELWRQAYPESHFLKLASVMRHYRSARTGTDRRTPEQLPEAYELREQHLRAAEQLLLDFPAHVKDGPLWHLLRLELASEQDNPTPKPGVLFAEATKKWPRDLSFYGVVLQELLPKSGGSWTVVESFIDQSSRQVQATEGQSFYARLYHQIGYEVVQKKTNVDWGRLMQGFEDWISQRMDFRIKNLYASYACASRDKSAFAKAMGHLGKDQLSPSDWLDGHSYEACTRWAGI
ncbi:MAG: DUF4034 domain-containing protein [Hylemonella sp.]|nr:DUF4034 domain-containing protein [Hylemonella sp.]